MCIAVSTFLQTIVLFSKTLSTRIFSSDVNGEEGETVVSSFVDATVVEMGQEILNGFSQTFVIFCLQISSLLKALQNSTFMICYI